MKGLPKGVYFLLIVDLYLQFRAIEDSESKRTILSYMIKKIGINNLFQIMSRVLRPRIDSNVTVQCNHLIKVPYSVHPNTGNF